MPRILPYYQRLTDGVPLIGNWVANAGKVERIITQPCEIDPAIWVTAFFNETPILLWSLVKPDPVDLTARDMARTGRKGLHERSRRQRKRPLFKFAVDGILPGVVRTRVPVPQALFTLGDFAQRVGWYIIVVDATSEFLVRWVSTAYQWQGCLVTPDWWKGQVGDAWTPAGGSGTFASPFEFETAGSTPNTFIGTQITQPAKAEMMLSAEIQLGRAQFTTGEWLTSAWLEEVESGTRHTIFDQQLVGNGKFPTGSIDHLAPWTLAEQHWRVMIQSDHDRVIANPNSHFTGFPPSDSFLNADPP